MEQPRKPLTTYKRVNTCVSVADENFKINFFRSVSTELCLLFQKLINYVFNLSFIDKQQKFMPDAKWVKWNVKIH